MNRKHESIKAVVFVGIGLMFGVLIMLSMQLGSKTSTDEKSKSAVSHKNGSHTEDADASNSEDSPTKTVAAAAQPAQLPARPSIPGLKACPNPLDIAMSQLNSPMVYQVRGNQLIPLQDGQTVTVAPEDAVQTAGGYQTGGYQGQSDTIQTGPYQQVSGQFHGLPALPVGRNGLLANPCVDPPSTHGIAYNRQYQ